MTQRERRIIYLNFLKFMLLKLSQRLYFQSYLIDELYSHDHLNEAQIGKIEVISFER